jgi:hypothetical protein
MICHNPECYGSTLVATLYQRDKSQVNDQYALGQVVHEWRLIPASRARPWPSCVPSFVQQDYIDACAIEATSPKASAAQSRRCLQALIRDYYRVSKSTLIAEINSIDETALGAGVKAAFHGLREIGNIGAHPQADPSTIVDVESGEATAMIDFLEVLIEETYIARQERDATVTRVATIAAKKKAGTGSP